MLLLLASIVDAAARAFADEYADQAAVSILTCRTLAEHSTSLRYPAFHSSTLTVSGRVLPVTAIKGLINLLPAVFPDELVFYPPEEQEYQASEFHALLSFFLTALACPVVNRPSAMSLNGPYPNPVGWYHLARRLGIPVASVRLDTDDFVDPFVARPGADPLEVTCLGGRLITPTGTPADEYTLHLARQAEVEYLRVVYSAAAPGSPQLLTARTTPDLRSPATCRALLDYFDRVGQARPT